MSKHTPGPWLRDGRTVYALMSVGFRRGVEHFKNRFWAGVQTSPECSEEEAEANARLIEAAPELLEALQTVRDYVVTMKGRGHEYQLIIDAAIAKATQP